MSEFGGSLKPKAGDRGGCMLLKTCKECCHCHATALRGPLIMAVFVCLKKFVWAPRSPTIQARSRMTGKQEIQQDHHGESTLRLHALRVEDKKHRRYEGVLTADNGPARRVGPRARGRCLRACLLPLNPWQGRTTLVNTKCQTDPGSLGEI